MRNIDLLCAVLLVAAVCPTLLHADLFDSCETSVGCVGDFVCSADLKKCIMKEFAAVGGGACDALHLDLCRQGTACDASVGLCNPVCDPPCGAGETCEEVFSMHGMSSVCVSSGDSGCGVCKADEQCYFGRMCVKPPQGLPDFSNALDFARDAIEEIGGFISSGVSHALERMQNAKPGDVVVCPEEGVSDFFAQLKDKVSLDFRAAASASASVDVFGGVGTSALVLANKNLTLNDVKVSAKQILTLALSSGRALIQNANFGELSKLIVGGGSVDEPCDCEKDTGFITLPVFSGIGSLDGSALVEFQGRVNVVPGALSGGVQSTANASIRLNDEVVLAAGVQFQASGMVSSTSNGRVVVNASASFHFSGVSFLAPLELGGSFSVAANTGVKFSHVSLLSGSILKLLSDFGASGAVSETVSAWSSNVPELHSLDACDATAKIVLRVADITKLLPFNGYVAKFAQNLTDALLQKMQCGVVIEDDSGRLLELNMSTEEPAAASASPRLQASHAKLAALSGSSGSFASIQPDGIVVRFIGDDVSSSPSSDDSGISSGAIVGISVGGVVVLALVVFLFTCSCRKRKETLPSAIQMEAKQLEA